MRQTYSYLLSLGCILCVAALAGCGTDAYNSRPAPNPLPPGAIAVDGRVGAEATLTHLQRETPFRSLWEKPITDLPQKKLTLRIPKLFRDGEAYALNPLPTLTPDPRRPEDVVDPNRVQPLFFELEGHQRTYEGFTKVPGRQTPDPVTKPIYLYIAYVDKQSNKEGKLLTAAAMERQLRDKLVKKFGKKDVSDWETVELLTPEGTTNSWRRLKATGEQWFFEYEGNVARAKNIVGDPPGVYSLYLRSMPDCHVMLGWNCLTNVAEAIGLDAEAEACAGTVKVAP